MKRYFHLFTTLLLVLLLGACGSSSSDNGGATSGTYGETRELALSGDTRAVVFGSDEMNFCVTSTLVIRNSRALLIDAKFSKTDANRIISYIQDQGLELTQIFISHGDPDYYFGLEEFKAVYPRVIARTTPETAKRITSTMLEKLVTWEPVLGDEIPQNLVVPQILNATSFTFEGLTIEIFGSDSTRIALYLPDFNMIVGGPSIVSGNHLFLADMGTTADLNRWKDNLTELRNLNPTIVIPGHTDIANERFTEVTTIHFSSQYLTDALSANWAQPSSNFINGMNSLHPNLLSYPVLELSGKVLSGEMTWE